MTPQHSFTKCQPGCKINLGLGVGPRRVDGYHELRTIFYPLPYPCDELEMAVVPEPGLWLECDDIPQKDNLVTKAYQCFLGATNCQLGVSIRLKKRIPAGAGLGGGSSDAAALLHWLNNQTGYPLSTKELGELGASLGADVPFFIINKPCKAAGIGTKLEPINLDAANLWLALLCPPVFSSTSSAYKKLDFMREQQKNLTSWQPAGKETLSRERVQDILELDLTNDLELPVFAAFPGLARLKDELCLSGASRAAMSGSGSAIYGIFEHPHKARVAAAKFRLRGIKTFIQPMQILGM